MAKKVLKIEKPLNGYSKIINKLKIEEYQFDNLISLAIPLNSERKCRLNFKKSLSSMPNIEKSIINKSGIQDLELVLTHFSFVVRLISLFQRKTVPLLNRLFI